MNISWNDPAGMPHKTKGFSRDMSASGVLVLADDVAPVGMNVEVELFVGSVVALSRLVIEAEGRVVRVEVSPRVRERAAAFAATLHAFTLRNEEGEVLE